MDRREREALDRYITGNYGEDQYLDGYIEIKNVFGEGWFVMVYPKTGNGPIIMGPTKGKPSQRKLMGIQNKYFDGRKVTVYQE